MPLSHIISPSQSCCIGIWTITETEDELQALLSQKSTSYNIPQNYTHNKRRLEWFAVRLILHAMLPHSVFDITYDLNGKPHLINPVGHISISHTKEIVSVMYHQTHNCGIDIELIKPRILKVAHKFLRDDEKEFLHPTNYLEKLFIIWGAKEVMFKIYSKGDLDFIQHLKVETFEFADKGKFKAHILKPLQNAGFTIHFLKKDDLLITYSVNEHHN